jgi:hypothetical protein
MARLAVAPVVKEGFALRLAEALGEGEAADTVVVRFTGTADMDATAALELFLKRLHTEVTQSPVRTVVFDLAALDFMNSSCFKCFVTWIDQVGKPNQDPHYEVRFVSNPQLQWQRRSLEALHRFAPDVVTLDPV